MLGATQKIYTTREVGRAAEKAVRELYVARGYTFLGQNFSSYVGKQVGEVDLIFRGPGTQQRVCFVEVKARSSRAAALSLDLLLPKFKRYRIAQTARYFMYSHPEYRECYWCFDLAIVRVASGSFDISPENITIVTDVNVNG